MTLATKTRYCHYGWLRFWTKLKLTSDQFVDHLFKGTLAETFTQDQWPWGQRDTFLLSPSSSCLWLDVKSRAAKSEQNNVIFGELNTFLGIANSTSWFYRFFFFVICGGFRGSGLILSTCYILFISNGTVVWDFYLNLELFYWVLLSNI